ncbi:MAG: hypothetical protein H0W85_05880 [Methylotenera sp.]|nr:hypothetical protein [Methylotenera sp.]
MVNLPNNLANPSLTKIKPHKPLIPTPKKVIGQELINANTSTKKPLDNYDESITEGDQILTQNLNSENDI